LITVFIKSAYFFILYEVVKENDRLSRFLISFAGDFSFLTGDISHDV